MERKVLVVDDDADVRETLDFWLDGEGYAVRTAASAEQAFSVVAEFRPEIVVTDLYMAGMNGLELLARLKASDADVDVVVVTGKDEMETAVEAIRAGAYDYLAKPLDPEELAALLARCFADRRARAGVEGEDAGGEDAGGGRPAGSRIIGRERAMLEIYKTIGRVAGTAAPVLIRGETGTGKEVVARAIHEHSGHAAEPFVAVNCTSVPDQLLESELFGHVRGSFTGAVSDRKGRFELAGHGTIFLDEIGDTAPSFQAKLLRVLQEKEFYPVGSEQPRQALARVIAATHRPVEAMVRDGSFREDLYYRLRVVEIHVPPLRDRPGDIPALADHFLTRAIRSLGLPGKVIPPDVMRALREHDWPGNVRELENAIARAAVLAQGTALRVEHLGIGRGGGGVLEAADSLSTATLDDAERRQLLAALERTGGNKRQAARILEISRPRLDRLIRKYDIDVAEMGD